jgi:hypothetical protein
LALLSRTITQPNIGEFECGLLLCWVADADPNFGVMWTLNQRTCFFKRAGRAAGAQRQSGVSDRHEKPFLTDMVEAEWPAAQKWCLR